MTLVQSNRPGIDPITGLPIRRDPMQVPQVPNAQYSGAIPEIAKAFENDPKTKIAMALMQQGGSTAPVAQGKWAWADGLSRVAQALAGSHFEHKAEQRYAGKEQEFIEALKKAAQPAFNPATTPANPAVSNPATVGAAALSGGQPAGFVPLAQGASSPAPNLPTGGPQGGSERFQQAFGGGIGGSPASASGGRSAGLPVGGVSGQSPMPAKVPAARELFYRGIVPIEGGTDSRGGFLTSPKGAIGPAQVMPGTAREAAQLAGLPYNEQLYRTDAQYNLKLGEAYYAKQLETFGDPLKAAAAYNAGPGGVQRAMRRARKNGGSYEQYLPGETKKYLGNFAEKVGLNGAAQGSSQTYNEDISAPGPVNVPAPQLEQVPGGLELPTQAPNAPDLPPAVQSRRLKVAETLINSGNPFLINMAKEYLSEGLTEQNASDVKHNEQEYGRQNMGYQSALNDFTDTRDDWRGQVTGERKDTIESNRRRQDQYGQNQFTANENAAQRELEADKFSADRRFDWQKTTYQEEQANRRNDATIQGRNTKADRNPWLDTPTGVKEQEKAADAIGAASMAIQRANRFVSLLDEQSTGGIYGVPGIGSIVAGTAGAFQGNNGRIAEMESLSNQMVLDMMPNGSLGAQVSNSDRDFVTRATPGIHARKQNNLNIAAMYKAAAQRKIEFHQGMLDAMQNQSIGEFTRDWSSYMASNPLVKRDKNNNAKVDPRPITFEQWRNRRRFDANGNPM